MPTSTLRSPVDLESIATDRRSPCECVHSDDDSLRCDLPATVRVTVVCTAEDCDCAVTVHLLCRDCLAAWREQAREDRIELRVTPL